MLLWVAYSSENAVYVAIGLVFLVWALFTAFAVSRDADVTPATRFLASVPKYAFTLLFWLFLLLLNLFTG